MRRLVIFLLYTMPFKYDMTLFACTIFYWIYVPLLMSRYLVFLMFTGSPHILYNKWGLPLVIFFASCIPWHRYCYQSPPVRKLQSIQQVSQSCIPIPCSFLFHCFRTAAIYILHKVGDMQHASINYFVTAKCFDKYFPLLVR